MRVTQGLLMNQTEISLAKLIIYLAHLPVSLQVN